MGRTKCTLVRLPPPGSTVPMRVTRGFLECSNRPLRLITCESLRVFPSPVRGGDGKQELPMDAQHRPSTGGSVRGPQGPGQQIPHRPSPGAPKLRPGGTLISPINPDTDKSVLTRRCSYSPRKFYSNFSIYLWLCWVFIAALALPPASKSWRRCNRRHLPGAGGTPNHRVSSLVCG